MLADLSALVERPPDPRVTERARDWLEADLRHHRHGTPEMLEDPDVDADARALHLLMEDAVRDREPRDGVLDEVAGRIAREPGAGGRPPSGGTLQERVDRYPSWHYAFDLGGGVRTTPQIPGNANRHEQRRAYFFEAAVERLGGSLEGRTVLDLGCNAGFWSLQAIEAGCEHVTGIDGRAMHVEQARLVFEARRVHRRRYEFRVGDVYADELSREGPFDVVLCLGLLYHVADPVGLFERLGRWTRELLIVDTTLAPGDDAGFALMRESLEDPRNALSSELVLRPTRRAVLHLAAEAGFDVTVLEPSFSDWTTAEDYRDGRRRAMLCLKRPG